MGDGWTRSVLVSGGLVVLCLFFLYLHIFLYFDGFICVCLLFVGGGGVVFLNSCTAYCLHMQRKRRSEQSGTMVSMKMASANAKDLMESIADICLNISSLLLSPRTLLACFLPERYS